MRFVDTNGVFSWLKQMDLVISQNHQDIVFPVEKNWCFEMPLPTPVYRISDLANFLLPYADDEFSTIHESLVWFMEWGIWQDIHERAAMYMMESMRRGNGETRAIADVPG